MEKAKEEYRSEKKNKTALKIKKINEKKLKLIEKMSLKKNGIARKQLLFSFFGSKTNSQPQVVETPKVEEKQTTKTK